MKQVTGTIRYIGFDTDIKTEVTFLDEHNNEINVKNSVINFNSLNSTNNDGSRFEGISNFNGEFIKFNGSSVDNHDGLAYSNRSNDKITDGSKYNTSDWDNDSDKSYYGAIVGKVNDDTNKIMFDIVSKNMGYVRFIFNDYKNKNVPVFPSEVKSNSNDCGVLRYKDQNGNWVPFQTLRGEKGEPGINGTNGKDGRSVTITENHQDEDGNTIITFSDGTTTQINRGEKGEKGDDGQNGTNGRDGVDGVNGTNGVDGRDGRDGRDGKDLTIKKTFHSVEAMNADTSLSEGDLAIISSNVDDEDNAKLYVKTANGYNYLTDLSGAKGIQGEAGRDGRDGTDGNSITMTNNEILDNGNTKVTLSDGNSFTVQKGQDGRDGTNGQDGHSPVVTIDTTTGHWKVDGVDTGVNGKAPELPYKTIVGPGRPDQPNTTGGKITGSEATGDEYVSTNGAGVGANVWKKVNGKWVVIQGDTGWRKITVPSISNGYLVFRRTAENCYVTANGNDYNTFKVASTANVERVQMGSSGQYRDRIMLTRMPQGWETNVPVTGQKVTHDGYDDIGNAVISSVTDQNSLQIRNYSGNKTANQLLRMPMLTYPNGRAWPNTLPGEATDL